MKKVNYNLIISIFFLLFIAGCFQFRKGDELTKFKSFQFSFRDRYNSRYFSLLFSQSDTVFLKRYSNSKADTLFYGILPANARSNLDNFARQIDSLSFDSLEDFDPQEARFALYFNYPDEEHDLRIHSENPPLAFKKFNNWVQYLIDSIKFKRIDTSVIFNEDSKIHKIIEETRNSKR